MKQKYTRKELEPAPLPRELCKHYDECYVKVILESLFPQDYSNLELSDAPDLRQQHPSIGIEVTNGTDPKEQMVASLFTQHIYATSPEKQEKALKTLRKNNCDIPTNGFCTRNYAIVDDDTRLQWADNLIVEKLVKLQDHYQLFERNELAIVIEEPIGHDIMMHHTSQVVQKNIGNPCFDCIYIITVNTVYKYDTNTNTCTYLDFASQQFEYSQRALRIVIDLFAEPEAQNGKT